MRIEQNYSNSTEFTEMSVAAIHKEISSRMAVRVSLSFTTKSTIQSLFSLLFRHREIELERNKCRMEREQTILGKFMYKCGKTKSPRTKSDFEMLLANVQKWKQAEVGCVVQSNFVLQRNRIRSFFFISRLCAFMTITKAIFHRGQLR